MGKIKAVIFDLDGTLYNQTLLRLLIIASFFLNIIIKPKKTYTAMKVLGAFRKAHEELRKLKTVDFIIADEQIRLTTEGSGLPAEKVTQIVDEWFYSFPLKFLKVCKRKNLESTINSLKSQGYKIGLFSDYYTERKLENMGLNGYFDYQLCAISREVNSLKPNVKGFTHIAEMMNVKPGECLYIGDRPHIDGVGAEAAGMIPVIISSRKKKHYRRLKSFDELKTLMGEIEQNH